MPANIKGEHIDAPPYNRNDGFSPGQTIVAQGPRAEQRGGAERTAPVPINHLGRYRDRNAPIVVIDANTGKRWPIWVEVDSAASDPSRRALLIHPAKNFAAGPPLHRRAAQPEDRRRQGDPGAAGVPLLPRRRSPPAIA